MPEVTTDFAAMARNAVEREAEQSRATGWRQRHFDALDLALRYARAAALAGAYDNLSCFCGPKNEQGDPDPECVKHELTRKRTAELHAIEKEIEASR